jgi:nucleoside-diphosphate-sugar epimerase
MGSLQEPDNEAPALPHSPYAAAKFAASCYARMFAQTFKLPITVARPFMVYGPGQMDRTKLVPHVLSQLLSGQAAKLTSGRSAFDWVHVEDVADALVAIAATAGLGGRTIDIGTGTLTSVRDVAYALAARLDAMQLIELGTVADRQGEPTRTADTQTTENLIHWRARINLDQGLNETVDWFRNSFGRAAAASPPNASRC